MNARTIAPRPTLDNIDLPLHGGLDYAELSALGLKPDDVVDFSANLNPRGAPPEVGPAIQRAAISRYPDSEASELRRALAATLDVDADTVIAGNGSSEIIWLIALAFLAPGDRVLIAGPTFGEYERAAKLAGAEIRYFDASPGDFELDLDALEEALHDWAPKVVFTCNPNNPTGLYLNRARVERLVGCCGHALLVLDEAYVGFVERSWRSLDLVERGVLILRSLTKDYGLAGLRLGYAIAERGIIAALRKARPPWNVNAIAQSAGCACLGNGAWVEESRRRMMEAKSYLLAALEKSGWRIVPSETTFFMAEVGDAAAVRRSLLRHGLLVRDCASFGLPRFVRLSPRELDDCRRLIEAVNSK